MPNWCEYEMKIKGSKDAIKRVVECLTYDYDYGVGKPTHKHFFRVFDCYYDLENLQDNKDGTYTCWLCGSVAWSVRAGMLSGESTYYDLVKKDHEDIFMGTDLLEQSQDCEIEVFGEEGGCLFAEHYHFKNGECLTAETDGLKMVAFDEDGNLLQDIDWDEYDGDIQYLSRFKEKKDGGGYYWNI
jgi:hypothetical protein